MLAWQSDAKCSIVIGFLPICLSHIAGTLLKQLDMKLCNFPKIIAHGFKRWISLGAPARAYYIEMGMESWDFACGYESYAARDRKQLLQTADRRLYHTHLLSSKVFCD